jgi:hypothetical protein
MRDTGVAERGDAGVAACCACSASLFISPAVKVTARARARV